MLVTSNHYTPELATNFDKLTFDKAPALPELNSRNIEEIRKYGLRISTKDQHLSYSAFAKFMTSPDAFIRNRLDEKDRKQTPAMLDGSIFHALTLEPEKFFRYYDLGFDGKSPSHANHTAFIEELSKGVEAEEAYREIYSTTGKSDKKIKELSESLKEEYLPYMEYSKSLVRPSGRVKTIITQKQFEHGVKLRDAVMYNRPARRLIDGIRNDKENGKFEYRAEWEYRGFKWKGFLDGIKLDNYIFDLKKIVTSTPRKVRNGIDYEGWGEQAGLYSIATEMIDKPYYMVAVDNDYQVTVMEVSKSKRVEKMRSVNWYLDQFENCLMDPSLFWASSDFYTTAESGIFVY